MQTSIEVPLEWEDPPEERQTSRESVPWDLVTMVLKSQPGKWAKLTLNVSAGNAATTARNRDLEAVQRDGQLWLRCPDTADMGPDGAAGANGSGWAGQ